MCWAVLGLSSNRTPGATIWKLKQRGWVRPGDNLRDWLRIGMPGELLQVAYVPVGVKDNGDDDDDDDSDDDDADGLRDWPRMGIPGELL